MTTLRRVTAFLNIRPGEERLIGLLVFFYFILAMAFVFVQSMAFGVFLAEYGPQGLPFSYITIAIFASLAAVLYIKIGEHVSFSALLTLNLVFLVIISFITWLGLKSPLGHYVSFLLPLLFQIVINQGNLAIWPLAGRLFDFGQGKRLFPLLGAGLWLANSIGGLLVSPLVAWIGAANLLLLAIASIGVAWLVLRVIVNTYLRQEVPVSQLRPAASSNKQSAGLLKNRHTLMIFVYIALWWMAFFFLDNIFSDRAAAQFPNVNQLTAFMGQLLAVTGIVALISSTLLNGRIIGRFGLRAGLIGMPLLVTLTVGALAMSGSMGAALIFVFGVAAFAKLINVAFGFSLSQSANAIVYQSLPDTIRGRVQATAEGVVQPIAIGLAGLSLLALTVGLKFNYIGLAYVFLGLAVAWLIVIFLLSRGYVKALMQVITKRRLGESPTVLADPISIGLLQGCLQDPHPGAAMYALTKLEELDSKVVASTLPGLIRHPAPEMRREAFMRIERLMLTSALDSVRSQLAVESEPNVREAGLRALGAIADVQAFSQLSNTLHESDAYSLRGALVGLLKYGKSDARQAAEQTFNRLLNSSLVADRILAAQVLGNIDLPQFYQAHQTLLCDPAPAVQRIALHSAGKIRQPALISQILEACDSPETCREAGLALTAMGESAIPKIETAFIQPDAPYQRLLILAKVLGYIGGLRAQALLHSRIDFPGSELRLQILNALSDCGYRAQNPAEISAAIKREVGWAARAWSAQADLGDTEETALLAAALRQFIDQARERVLLLLSFVLDSRSVLSTREAFFTGSKAQSAYALEIIDAQLPAEWKRMVMPVLEDATTYDRLQHLAAIIPQAPQKAEDRLHTLIDGPEAQQFTNWVRVCAIYTAARLSTQSCYDAITIASNKPDALISDTARWALTQFAPGSQKGNKTMLSTIEKVIILKTVDMFGQTPDDVLADVADLLEEMEVSEGETIFKQGDLGDSMYVIIDGKVRVHDGERLLNYLGERDVFGEMALLDPEPRLASVTAVEPTRLFRLDQGPFYELLTERPEVATGIIRVLTNHLRNRVRDMAHLAARNEELESMVHSK